MVVIPKIDVAGISFVRQSDGSYTAQVARSESRVVNGYKDADGVWHHHADTVPWDMRLDQEWLRLYPTKWVPG